METPIAGCSADAMCSLPIDQERASFVAINYISCTQGYRERFECLFCSRAQAIDRMAGFCGMHVLRAANSDEPYLVVSYWKSKDHFDAWVGSSEFVEGHQRGFADLRRAKEQGEEPPMSSKFVTYEVLTR
ncbi:MAG: Heme oxygenase (staphylobilin-producing) [Fimbriimonadaceae bacterium]|nr:Heme oxygenase (staphylobilin-producing) [Fimbriimonadaceae bacterium]